MKTTPAPIHGYITTAEAAVRASKTQRHIRLLMSREILKGIKLAPRLWLVETASLDEYLKVEHKRGPKPQK